MIDKCPQCGFEPLDGAMVCPECGNEIKENIARKLADIEDKNIRNNDSVSWEEFKDVPLGSVLETFSDDEGKVTKKELDPEADLDEENPVLAEYMRKHRGGEEQAEGETETVTESDAATDETPAETTEEDVAEDAALTEPVDTPEASEAVEPESEPEPTMPAEPVIDPIEPPLEAEEAVEEPGLFTRPTAEEPTFDPAVPLSVEDEVKAEGKAPQTEAQPPKKPRNKKPLVILAAAALVACAGGLGYHQYHSAQVAQEQKETAAFTKLQKQLDDFYFDDDQQFVTAKKTTQDVKDLMKKLEAYKDQPEYSVTEKEADAIEAKYEKIDEVNALFAKPAIKDDALDKKIAVKNAQDVAVTAVEGDSAFAKLINSGIDDAKEQVKNLKDAADKLGKVYSGNKVVDNVTREQYDAAKAAIDKVVDSPQKTEFYESLKKVDSLLKGKEAEAKQAEEAAAAAAEAAQVQSNAEQAITGNGASLPAEASPNMVTNDQNQPILGTVDADVADVNNAAWAWAPGVKEKVIATCIARGYIVEGGYSLVPVRIENGEGYYNLFATNTQSSFMQGIAPSALPYYLVTINDKTGYFRGNGNDHTIR